MMKKVFQMKNLDCASCAAKMERGVGKIAGVAEVSVNFMTQRMTLEAEEGRFDAIVSKAREVVRRIERGCELVEQP